jgi:hypothetical protein
MTLIATRVCDSPECGQVHTNPETYHLELIEDGTQYDFCNWACLREWLEFRYQPAPRPARKKAHTPPFLCDAVQPPLPGVL